MKFSPEIVVIAGSSGSGLLAEEFSMTYSVTSEEKYIALINKSLITVGIEEPFNSLPVRTKCSAECH